MRAAASTVLLTLVPSLPALAYASPPDPVWIEGLYDDGDRDDVIGLATSATAVTGRTADVRPLPPERGEVTPARREAPDSSGPSVARSRAPPVA
jgi:hypothetical protein